MTFRFSIASASAMVLLVAGAVSAQEATQENASNPLAAVNNVDFRWNYLVADGGDLHDIYLDGAMMLGQKVKLKYELHYNVTDITGTNEQDFEKVVIKPIYFPFQKKLGDSWGLRAAVGVDLAFEFGNEDKGIGVGADTIGPFLGVALAHGPSGLVLIPLLQHFAELSGPDISITALRLIALKPLGKDYWAKVDVKIPYDWNRDVWLPTAELQVGYNINANWAVYVDGFVGMGKDRPYDVGVGLGVRFKY
jgi:hypothetical protein